MLAQVLDALGISPREVLPVPESYSSQVFRLRLDEGEVILKIPYSRAKLMREKEMLTKLQGLLPVPRLLDFYPGDDKRLGALLLSYIDGRPATSDDYSLSYQMGELLARLHQVSMDSYTLATGESEWWKAVEKTFTFWLTECSEALDPNLISTVTQHWYGLYTSLPQPDGPCVVHMDYRPGNILVRDNQIVGLIDFESARGGSADVDFTKMKLYMWDPQPSSKEPFLAGYESIRQLPRIEVTMPFYLLHNAFGGLAWAIRRGQQDGEFFKESFQQLTSVLKHS